MMRNRKLAVTVLLALLSGLFATGSRAEDALEQAGVVAGVTAGNMWFLPAKVFSVTLGTLSGGLSLLLTGNIDLSKQIWQDTTEGPYAITPDVAKKAVGERPELLNKK